MDSLDRTVAFFDIGQTLASVTLSPTNDRIASLTAYPYVLPILATLRERGVRPGIISDRGPVPADEVNRALDAAGLLQAFDPDLIVYGKKDGPAIFEAAAALAGAASSTMRLLFVGEDPAERAHALTAGFLVAPHPRMALSVLEGDTPLRYVRITVPPAHAETTWRAALRELPIVPLHATDGERVTVYALVGARTAAHLDDLGFHVDRLGDERDALTADLYLLRDDRQQNSSFLSPDGNSRHFFEAADASRHVLASTSEGLLVAVPAGQSVESYHFVGAQHGHNLKLVPSFAPLAGEGPERYAALDAPSDDLAAAGPALSAAEVGALLKTFAPARLREQVERYTGVRSIDGNGTFIRSRHIVHPDNARAVDALVSDLANIGNGRFAVRRHRFTHNGLVLENVEAELAGRGRTGVVLLTAHLDSTGARQPGYRPAVDEANGADDDASGTASVLVAARTILALDAALGTPRHAFRFVLFNAEEHGLVGSRAYARDQAALAAPIVAVFQLDMIGYDVLTDRSFELHAGFSPSLPIQNRSLKLARRIATMIPLVSPTLPAPQMYPETGVRDPAEQRSDHYSFQVEGYAACLATEDLFAGPGPHAPAPDPNPNYHLPTDDTIDVEYAADIARAVTAAAWVTATR